MRTHRSSLAPAAAILALAGTGANAAEYFLPRHGDVIGQIRQIAAHHEDTFVALARRYGVGFEELKLANPGVDAWLPGEGTLITLPTKHVLPRGPREGIVVNVAELRLYYFPVDEPEKVHSYPISVGRTGWGTPLGATSVVAKHEDPAWYPPQSIRDEHAARGDTLPAVVPPGPNNPLGRHALRLGLPGYLIHGTNKPAGIGMRVTHGCFRMFPEDVEALFARVPTDTPVHIVNQPYKVGWNERGELLLEAHPPLEEELEAGLWTLGNLAREFAAVTGEAYRHVRWDQAQGIVREPLGLPIRVAVRIPLASQVPLDHVDAG